MYPFVSKNVPYEPETILPNHVHGLGNNEKAQKKIRSCFLRDYRTKRKWNCLYVHLRICEPYTYQFVLRYIIVSSLIM